MIQTEFDMKIQVRKKRMDGIVKTEFRISGETEIRGKVWGYWRCSIIEAIKSFEEVLKNEYCSKLYCPNN